MRTNLAQSLFLMFVVPCCTGTEKPDMILVDKSPFKRLDWEDPSQQTVKNAGTYK